MFASDLGSGIERASTRSECAGHSTPRASGFSPASLAYSSAFSFPATPLCAGHNLISMEKADEWAKIAAEEPDIHGVKWLNFSDRTEVRAMRLPRSLANLKREISEEKWVEARQWAGRRTSKKKYRMPKSQRPDSTVAGSTRRLALRFYQIKTGHCLTGQYLN